LTKGPRRDQLWIHPEDAARRAIADGDQVMLASRVGEISVTAKVTDRVMAVRYAFRTASGKAARACGLALASALLGCQLQRCLG